MPPKGKKFNSMIFGNQVKMYFSVIIGVGLEESSYFLINFRDDRNEYRQHKC